MSRKGLKNVLQWEYWPSFMFYIPNIPFAVYLAFKARSLTFYTAVNPALPFSGNGTESKFMSLQLVPDIHKPASIIIKKNTTLEQLEQQLASAKLNFPLIGKPDKGFRGLGVKLLRTTDDLNAYYKKYSHVDFIIQEFIDLPNECGIFYHKLPNSDSGVISSITLKKYSAITGDGKSTLKTLIQSDIRAQRYSELLFKLNQSELEQIVPKGKTHTLNYVGNHSKGTQFINGNKLISPELTTAFDRLFQQIPNMNYGRVDLKYDSFDAICSGNFKIIELNGIISEPTHIYDPQHINFWGALKAIRQHWEMACNIAIQHHRNGIPYDSAYAFCKSLYKLKKYTRNLKSL